MLHRRSRFPWFRAASTLARLEIIQAHSVGPTEVNTFGVIAPGIYRIFNDATRTTLRSYLKDDPIVVSATKENPGSFELWEVKSAVDGSNQYTIFNVGGLKTSTFARDDGLLISGNPGGARDSFSIERAGDGVFLVRVPNEDKVWTVANPIDVRSSVKLYPQTGASNQNWRFLGNYQ
ncbi:hypothetical protein DFH09DRAFT_1108159 [Mycena vulgaris]|nr:hypothetical protein DFH09DRAFT_1108159 [Mycena vulgaris]